MGKITALCSRCAKYHELENRIYTEAGVFNLDCPHCGNRLAFKKLTGDILRDTVKKKLDSHPRNTYSANKVLDGIQSLIASSGRQIIDLRNENKRSWITKLLKNPFTK